MEQSAGTITELQALQSQMNVLTEVLQGVERGESNGSVCPKVLAHMQKYAVSDTFVSPAPSVAPAATEGGAAPMATITPQYNPYHTSASPAASDGCCVIV